MWKQKKCLINFTFEKFAPSTGILEKQSSVFIKDIVNVQNLQLIMEEDCVIWKK